MEETVDILSFSTILQGLLQSSDAPTCAGAPLVHGDVSRLTQESSGGFAATSFRLVAAGLAVDTAALCRLTAGVAFVAAFLALLVAAELVAGGTASAAVLAASHFLGAASLVAGFGLSAATSLGFVAARFAFRTALLHGRATSAIGRTALFARLTARKLVGCLATSALFVFVATCQLALTTALAFVV